MTKTKLLYIVSEGKDAKGCSSVTLTTNVLVAVRIAATLVKPVIETVRVLR